MTTITDMRGRELNVVVSSGGYELTVQATLSSTRQLDRANVGELLREIAKSSHFRLEMHAALATVEVRR
jgi:prophage antirepressor-like protein